MVESTAKSNFPDKRKKRNSLGQKVYNQRYLLMMLIPCLLYYVIFKYIPMYGLIISFKKYDFVKGIMKSEWVGLKYFIQFFKNPYFTRVLFNTLNISVSSLIWSFPAPIIFALLLNEVRGTYFKKVVQTATYLPHFISLVIIVGLMKQLVSPTTGVINKIITMCGGDAINFFMEKKWFVPLYIISEIWCNFGWGAIVYIAAIAGINQELYEAATVDGAGRFKKVWHITIPGILPTVIIMLILKLGGMLAVGYEKILLMYNESTYETADVISTYVYRNGIQQFNYSYGTAVGLMNAIVDVMLIVAANYISNKVADTGLW